MNPEQIQALKQAHPQEFAAKRAAGLSDAQAAHVIAAQIEHDKLHPPGPIALGKARNLVELFTTRFEQLKHLAQEALEAIAEASRLNPDLPGEELPSMPSFISGSTDTSLREHLAKREQDVIDLGAANALKSERIEQLEAEAEKIVELETELAELKPRLTGLQLDHQALLTERDALKTQLSEAAKAKPKK
jgi:hypothetical protein